MNGAESAIEENRIRPITTMKKQPTTKLRSLKIAKRRNGSSVVSERSEERRGGEEGRGVRSCSLPISHGGEQDQPHPHQEEAADDEIAILEDREAEERLVGRQRGRGEKVKTRKGDDQLGADIRR